MNRNLTNEVNDFFKDPKVFAKRFEGVSSRFENPGLPEPIGLSEEMLSDQALMDRPEIMAARERLNPQPK